MNVTAKNWQSSADAIYQSYGLKENRDFKSGRSQDPQTAADTDILESSSASVMGLDSNSDKSSSGFKMKSSTPENSVGQLAAMLSQAETVLDVQQVMSKAMRALAELKMGAIASEGKEAQKAAQQIKRMEKLIKRIQKKLKHLSKEQRLEDQRKKALENAETEKAKQIEEDLKARRKKRQRDERRYALREMSEDQKTASNELVSSMSDSLSAGSSPDLSALTGISGDMMAAAGISADFSGMEGMSIDISV